MQANQHDGVLKQVQHDMDAFKSTYTTVGVVTNIIYLAGQQNIAK